MEYDYIAFTDGSAQRKGDYLFNGGSATVLLDVKTRNVYQKGKSLPDRSNNYSELYAVLMTLEMIKKIKNKKHKADILIISDSKYTVDTFSEWVYLWSKDKEKDDTWTVRGKKGTNKVQNEKLIKHIFYEFVLDDDYNITFVHMNSHKTMSNHDIQEMKHKIEKQGFSISEETVKVFIKYNSIADKISYRCSSDA